MTKGEGKSKGGCQPNENNDKALCISKHMKKRAAERNISDEKILAAFLHGRRTAYSDGAQSYYHHRSGIILWVKNGVVMTVYRKRKKGNAKGRKRK